MSTVIYCPNCDGITNPTGCQSCGWKHGEPHARNLEVNPFKPGRHYAASSAPEAPPSARLDLDGPMVVSRRAYGELQREVTNWKNTATEMSNGVEYYRGIVVKVGELFGDAAKTCDDGSKSEDVLCAKVYDLVKNALATSGVESQPQEGAVTEQAPAPENPQPPAAKLAAMKTGKVQ